MWKIRSLFYAGHVYVKVVKAYKGSNSDQLDLEVGDIIQVLEEKVWVILKTMTGF